MLENCRTKKNVLKTFKTLEILKNVKKALRKNVFRT